MTGAADPTDGVGDGLGRDRAGALDRTSDAVLSVDDGWRVTAWNRRMAALTGIARDDAVGATVWTAFGGGDLRDTAFAAALRETGATGRRGCLDVTLPGVGSRLTVRTFPDDEGVTAYLRPTSDRTRTRELQRSREVLDALHDSVLVLDGDLLVEFVRLPGRDPAGIEGRDARAVVADLAGPADADRFLEAARGVLDGGPGAVNGGVNADGGGGERRGEGGGEGGGSGPVYRRLTFAYGTGEDARYVDHRLTRVRFGGEEHVLVVGRDVTDRTRFERQLRALQSIARDLNVATDAADVAERAVDAAAAVIDMPLTGVWLADDDGDALVPAAVTASSDILFGDQPAFERDESIAWTVYAEEELRRIDDMSAERGRHNDATVVRSELIAPLGEHGVMLSASLETTAFDDADVDLFRTLAATVEAALTRADRERRLQERNRQLERFSDVVAHDIRNPLAVASGHLGLARERGDDDHFDRVERALDRIERLVDELLTLARTEGDPEGTEPLDPVAVARSGWETVDTGAATLTVEGGIDPLEGDEGMLTQLFENCYRNAVDHAGPSAEVTIGPLDGGGFYVADDGPGVPADVRDEVFEHGFTTDDDGTGFGLAIVASAAEASGLRPRVVDGEAGGARFEFVPV